MGEVNSSALAGKRVVVTRAALQSGELVEQLTLRGAAPMLFPLVAFAAADDYASLDAALAEMEGFDWIVFTSVNAVQHVCARLKKLGHDISQVASAADVAAVGPATAEAANAAGFLVDHVATSHSGVALAQELGNRVRGKKVFLPRSDKANPDLPLALKREGAVVTEVIAYRTLRPSSADQQRANEILNGGADAILFFSPTAVDHFAELAEPGLLRSAQCQIAFIAIGPVTANALREANVKRITVAADTTPTAAVEALEEYFAGRRKQEPAGVKRG